MKKKLFEYDEHRLIMKLDRFWDVRGSEPVLNFLTKENDETALRLQVKGYLDERRVQGQRFYVPTNKLIRYLEDYKK